MGKRQIYLDVPVLSISQFRNVILNETKSGKRIASLFGMTIDGQIKLIAVLAQDSTGAIAITFN